MAWSITGDHPFSNPITWDDDPLTPELMMKLAREACQKASRRFMEIHGYILIVRDRKVIRQYASGQEEIIKHIT